MKKILFLFSMASLYVISFSIFMVFIFSCTENQRVKSYGGSASITLPKNQKLVNVTWKETQLWILTKQVDSIDKPETYIFKEKSSYGVMEGEYTIFEQK